VFLRLPWWVSYAVRAGDQLDGGELRASPKLTLVEVRPGDRGSRELVGGAWEKDRNDHDFKSSFFLVTLHSVLSTIDTMFS
jgi:hypothetical protein